MFNSRIRKWKEKNNVPKGNRTVDLSNLRVLPRVKQKSIKLSKVVKYAIYVWH